MSLVFPFPERDEHDAGEVAQSQPCFWCVVGTAVAGESHLRKGIPCQDYQSWRLLPSGDGQALLVALADGAGSAEHSHLGARLAVETALQALESGLTCGDSSPLDFENCMRLAFDSAQQALFETAEADDIPLRSLATTLTCIAAVDGFITVGQLGDGSVVVQTSDEELVAVTQPQRGEYANETYFLVQEDALEYLQVQVLHYPVRALAVLSDGLMRLAMQMPSNQPHVPFFKPLFAFAASVKDPEAASGQLASFLSSERVSARTEDDKSLVLAICSPAPIDGDGGPRG
jgi:serine/threonine protein phosphatase PrpC